MNCVLRVKEKGFTLIEVLVVLGVIGLLMAFAVPDVISSSAASGLTGEGTTLESQLALAQQTASSTNSDVEVRFFRFADARAAETEQLFRGYQFFQLDRLGVMKPISKFFRIRAPVVLSNQSTLLMSGRSASRELGELGYSSPERGSLQIEALDNRTTEFVSFRFRPDGSTNLPARSRSGSSSDSDTWYVILVGDASTADIDDPDNFVCIQVNPFNGKVTSYRP